MTLRNRVRERRLELGWTQADVAELAGISRQVVILLERDSGYKPSAGTMFRLADALETTLDKLFSSEPDAAPAELAV